ncbi:MAG: glycosyl hydrolase 108 family protein [Candidatus Reddybacter sp.]
MPGVYMHTHSDEVVESWLVRIVGHEGGFSDDRLDPGNWTGGIVGQGMLKGTRFGISAKAYPDLDVQALSIDDAVHLYQCDYVRPMRLGRYRDGVAFQLLDFAVLAGPVRAVWRLQRAMGVVTDGIAGPLTLAALESRAEADVIMLLLAERIEFLTYLRNWPDAGKGWMRRVAGNLRFGAVDSEVCSG